MRKLGLTLLALGALSACGDDDSTNDSGIPAAMDAGVASDSGTTPDAGIPTDTGVTMDMDMGVADSGAAMEAVAYAHGVASGDPLASQVIIWTRVTPMDASLTEVSVSWEVAADSSFTNVVQTGMVTTSTSVDLTVKADVTGLSPGTQYWYRFTALGATSPVGRTKTLPMGPVNTLRFAVVSCSNFAAGLFNVYRLIANRNGAQNDLDAVLHLGDYFYEYGAGGFGDNNLPGRIPVPDIETIDLAAYRGRHAQYKSDPDLQAMHAAHPMIAVWDDHESANDAWKDGAENHTPGLPPEGEGDWNARKAEAIQAYYEWMPIRTPEMGGSISRRFDFGELASLHMIDTRLEGRDQQIDIASYFGMEGFDTAGFLADFLNPQRTMLGTAQEQWLSQSLTGATTTWQILGNQVMMGQIYTPNIPNPTNDPNIAAANQVAMLGDQLNAAGLLPGPGLPFNFDAWDGYVAAREQLFATMAQLANPIVITGDFHNAWAVELVRDADLLPDGAYDPATSAGTVGVEFVTSSVTSPGFEAALPDAFLDPLLGFIGGKNPHIKYADLRQRGFLSLELSSTEARAQFIFTPSIMSASDMEVAGPTFTVTAGSKRLVQQP